MRFKTALPLAVFVAVFSISGVPTRALTPTAQEPNATAPDNSAHNKQQTTTADSQTNAANDREAARKIRKSVIADKSLSTYAHNVKIIVVNGSVTLKGPVKSEDEKKRIGDLATEVIGSADKVSNEISVKAGS